MRIIILMSIIMINASLNANIRVVTRSDDCQKFHFILIKLSI